MDAAGVCTSDDSTSFEDLAIYGTTAVIAMGLSIILAMQLDGVSRRFLSPTSLLAKRRREYRYAVEQGNEYTALMIRQHVGGGKGLYDPKTESVVWAKIGSSETEEMDTLLSEIMDAKKATPVIVAIEQDLEDDNNPNDYHLFLAFPPASVGVSTPAAPNLYQRVRVPLFAFCERLANAFKEQMTSTALCFAADASSGMGAEMLTDVAKDCNYGVATISNPAWMTTLALIVSKNTQNITTQQFETIIFALCRLDAFRVRESVGVSRTVLFALPGQACVPQLLPLIQKVFVHERHLFVYDDCCDSVEYGLGMIEKYGSSYRQKASKEEWELVSETPTTISATVPIAPLRHIRARALPDTLTNLNSSQASIVEAWMASVDMHLDMKSREKKISYAPFVCRVGVLMKRSGIGNEVGSDVSELALKNVLEFISGSKSRALPEEVLEAAQSSLKRKRSEFEGIQSNNKLSPDEKILIEKSVCNQSYLGKCISC
ncbi:hypothetical protein QTG54_004856 [Skeletonema marinoi]|uniref:Uncharacterized protein n=1 Tax=Skeletonema marinoi TaxID=267567 RepID=A0AAD8YDM7_9STRA|nr:hypothetical protein QTG54_004856 [Skeletonema marinoi]